MKVEERVQALAREGINVYRHRLILGAPDSSLIFQGDVRFTGEIKHRTDSEVHIFHNEELLLKPTPSLTIAEYEDGVEVATYYRLANEKLEQALMDGSAPYYLFSHPLVQYLLLRVGLSEADVAGMFELAKETKKAWEGARSVRGTAQTPEQKLKRLRLEAIMVAEEAPILIGQERVYRTKDKETGSYLYKIALQHRRIYCINVGVWIPVVDFLLPSEKYRYESGSTMPEE